MIERKTLVFIATKRSITIDHIDDFPQKVATDAQKCITYDAPEESQRYVHVFDRVSKIAFYACVLYFLMP